MSENVLLYLIFQVSALNESEYQEDLDDAKEAELEKGSKACLDKLIGYEILLDDTTEPEMPEFSGRNLSEQICLNVSVALFESVLFVCSWCH